MAILLSNYTVVCVMVFMVEDALQNSHSYLHYTGMFVVLFICKSFTANSAIKCCDYMYYIMNYFYFFSVGLFTFFNSKYPVMDKFTFL